MGLWNECRSKHYEKTDIDLVKYAVETDWTSFQNEFLSIGKKNIKPIHLMRINKYEEEVKETIGHLIKKTNQIIAERKTRAVIVHDKINSTCDALIRLIVSEPRGAKAGSKPDIQTVDPPPMLQLS